MPTTVGIDCWPNRGPSRSTRDRPAPEPQTTRPPGRGPKHANPPRRGHKHANPPRRGHKHANPPRRGRRKRPDRRAAATTPRRGPKHANPPRRGRDKRPERRATPANAPPARRSGNAPTPAARRRQCALSRAASTSRKPRRTAHEATRSGRGPTSCAGRARGRRRTPPALAIRASRAAAAEIWASTDVRCEDDERDSEPTTRTPRRRGDPSRARRRSMRSLTSSTSAHHASRASAARGIDRDANNGPGRIECHNPAASRENFSARVQCPATAATNAATSWASLPW